MATVLIVDDDPEIREALADALEGRGYTVAGDGAEALDLLRKSAAPCLIVLDLMMPGPWTDTSSSASKSSTRR